MAYIQRPGAKIIASEYEWKTVERYVLPDAIPIIILWPFSPIRFVYELEDTGPPISRENINDPFAAKGELSKTAWPALLSNLEKQKAFRIIIEPRREGFNKAGSVVEQGVLNFTSGAVIGDFTSGAMIDDFTSGAIIGDFARENGATDRTRGGVPSYRITVNDRLQPNERFVTVAHELGHIFCGHLGGNSVRFGNNDESGWPDRQNLGKNEKEIEAEAVAYLAASRAGIVANSASYIKDYAEKADLAKVDLELIVRASARIERLAKIHYGSLLFEA